LTISPALLKGGLVLIDPVSSAVQRVIALQYNPDSLSRSFQVQAAGGESQNRSEALRLKGPPVETIKLDAEIDATDLLDAGDQTAATLGIHAQIAALETVIYPTTAQLRANDALQNTGTLEILPMETPLTLFVWSKTRILPVRVTELSVTEEAFDPNLNPIRAKVSIGMRVLSVDDLGFRHKGGDLFLGYLQRKEAMAALVLDRGLSRLGLDAIP
jgi:contractile injection system tube protein